MAAGRAGQGSARLVAQLLGVVARAALGLVSAALTLALLAELALAGAAWRLAEDPVRLDALLRRAALLPDDAEVGRISLAWAGWRGGPGEPVQVRVQDLRAASLPGVAALRLDEGEVALALAPLLHGVAAPVTVEVTGLDARLAPAEGGAGAAWPSRLDLDALRTVSVRDARVAGTLSGVAWNAQVAAQGRQDPEGAATGDLTATLAAGTVSVPVQASVTRAAGGALHVEAKSGEVHPAALAASFGTAVPALAGLAALDAPVALTASLDLSASLDPIHATINATAGAGTARLAGGLIPLDGAEGDVALAWDGSVLHELAVPRLAATVRSPSGGAPTALQLSGTARAATGGGWHAEGRVAFDQVAAADLPRLWPPDAIRHARRWVVENITDGTARAGQFAATLDIPADLADARLAAVFGTMRGEDLTIHWLRPLPPVEHARATLEFADPDTIRIAVLGGQQGSIHVPGGTILLTGLAGHDQDADIALDLAGPVAGVVALLSHPRLKLLSKRPLPFAVAAGQLAGRLEVRLPLIADLDVDTVAITAHAQLSGVWLRNVVAGRDLTRGALDLDVDNAGLSLGGTAQLAGVPSRLAVEADFRAGPPSQVLLTADATGRVTEATLEREGLDAKGVLAGAAVVSVRYALRRDRQAEVSAQADLGEAAVSTPLWHKAAGAKATARAKAKLQDDRLVAVEELHAQGPGLLIAAQAEVVAGRPAVLRLDRLVLDRTEAAGEVRLPAACGGAVCVRLKGPTLDLSAGLGNIAPARPGADRSNGTPWRAEVRFDRVLLDQGRALGPVRADGRSDGKRLVAATLDAPGVEGRLREQGRGRVTSLRAADAGALLTAAGVTDVLHRGRLRFDGRFDDERPGAPLTGTVEMADFAVQREVVAGKVLQALTIYGILDAIRGPGLFFSRAIVPIRYASNVLELREARASSAALGVTATGRLDLARDTVDLQGTIVPAYILNSALGRLPLVGRLFSPERGGGLVAADFSVRGRLDDPSVSINPLSILTPGALRNLFDIFK